MAHRDSQTGKYNEMYPLEAFVQALDRLGGDVGTKDVQEAVECQYRTAIAKLHELEDKGVVTSRRVGNAYLWSLAGSRDTEDHSVDQDRSSGESPPAEDAGSSRSTDPYDPVNEFE